LIEFNGSNDRLLLPNNLFTGEVIDSIHFEGDGVTLTIPQIESML